MGCGGDERELPSWLGTEFRPGLSIRHGNPAQTTVTGEQAIELVRQKVFYGGGPQDEPDAFLTRITGRFGGEGRIRIGSSGVAILRKAKGKPAWLIVWRGEGRQILSPPGSRDENGRQLVDITVLIDAQTGEKLELLVRGGASRFPEP